MKKSIFKNKYLRETIIVPFIIIAFFIVKLVITKLPFVKTGDPIREYSIGITIAGYGIFLCLYYLIKPKQEKYIIVLLGVTYAVLGIAYFFLFQVIFNIIWVFIVIILGYSFNKILKQYQGIYKYINISIAIAYIVLMILIVLKTIKVLNIDNLVMISSIIVAAIDLGSLLIYLYIKKMNQIKKEKDSRLKEEEVINLERLFNNKNEKSN